VSSADFFFHVEFSNRSATPKLLADLSSSVLRHAGCADQATPDLAEALARAIDKGLASGHDKCDVRFEMRGAQLEILVSCAAGRIWQSSRPIS
jgi:hypothetical protein